MSYQKEQQEKLEKLQKFEENFQFLKEKLVQSEKILEEASHELSEIRKEYSKQLDEKIIDGLKELNFADVDFSIRFDRRKNYTDNGYDAVEYEISTNPGESRKPLGADRYPVVSFPGSCLPSKRSLQIRTRSIR